MNKLKTNSQLSVAIWTVGVSFMFTSSGYSNVADFKKSLSLISGDG